MNFMNAGFGPMHNPPLFALLILWSLFWKGLSLWHSATRRQGLWFIVLLIINTVGILDIIYLFAVLKLKSSELIPKKHSHHE